MAKVCIVGPAYPYRGGIAHFTSLLAQEFAKDHDVFVVNFKRQYPSLLFPGKTQYDESNSPLAVDSLRVIDSLNPFSFWQAARRIAGFGPDLVVFQWWQPFFAFACRTIVYFLRRLCSARIVFLCHNVLPHESSPVDRVLIKIGLGGVTRFMVQSEEDRRNLLRIRPHARVSVNPHPIYDVFNAGRWDRTTARGDLKLDGRVILFFGYIRAYKGLRVLLEGFAQSLQRCESTLVVVGEFYEDRQPYDKLIDDLGIRSRVRIVDRYVPNEEVEKYFDACDVVVLPYLSATQSGIVQIAYGFEKPVIVTSVGGLPDVVRHGETGFLVPPNDAPALAAAICEFFEHSSPGDIARGIAAAKARFSWRRCAELLIELSEAR